MIHKLENFAWTHDVQATANKHSTVEETGIPPFHYAHFPFLSYPACKILPKSSV